MRGGVAAAVCCRRVDVDDRLAAVELSMAGANAAFPTTCRVAGEKSDAVDLQNVVGKRISLQRLRCRAAACRNRPNRARILLRSLAPYRCRRAPPGGGLVVPNQRPGLVIEDHRRLPARSRSSIDCSGVRRCWPAAAAGGPCLGHPRRGREMMVDVDAARLDARRRLRQRDAFQACGCGQTERRHGACDEASPVERTHVRTAYYRCRSSRLIGCRSRRSPID